MTSYQRRFSSTRLPTREEASGDKAPIGVLFVHGIGEQSRGDTMLGFGEPLQRWVQYRLRQGNPVATDTDVHFTDVSLATDGADGPPHAHLTVEEHNATASNVNWLMAESWWARSFRPASFLDVVWFVLGVAPPLIWRSLIESTRRNMSTVGNYLLESTPKSSSARQVLGKIGTAAGIGFSFLILVGQLVPVLVCIQLVLIALLLIAIVPPLRGWATAGQHWLAAVAGDSYVLASSPLRRAAMVSQVQRDIDWLARRSDAVVVVAHSQGAAVALRALQGRRHPKVRTLMTVGSGISKLRTVERLLEQEGRLRLAAALAGLGTLSIVAAFLLVVSGAGNVAIGVCIVGFAAWTLSLHMSLASSPHLNVKDLHVSGLEHGGTLRWLDLIASADPVPDGPLYAAELAVSDSSSAERLANLSVQTVSNEGSFLRDHSTYFENNEEVIAPAIQFFLDAADSKDAATPLRLAEPTMRNAAHRRQQRVTALANTRIHVLAAGAVTIGLLGEARLVELGRDVGTSVAGAVGMLLPGLGDMMHSLTDRSIWAATLGMLVIAILTLGFYRACALTTWHAWDRTASISAFDTANRPSTVVARAMFLVATLIPLIAALVVHRAVNASGFTVLVTWALLFLVITVVAVASAGRPPQPPQTVDGAAPVTHPAT